MATSTTVSVVYLLSLTVTLPTVVRVGVAAQYAVPLSAGVSVEDDLADGYGVWRDPSFRIRRHTAVAERVFHSGSPRCSARTIYRTTLVPQAGFAALRRRKRPAPRSVEHGRRPYGETRSEEHTSELQSLMRISYAVF